MFRSTLSALALAFLCGQAMAAFDALPKQGTTLQGSWQFNAAASDDVDAIVAKLIAAEEKERRQWRKEMERRDRFSEPDAPASPESRFRKRREQELRRQLGITNSLTVTQSGSCIELTSDGDTRRYEAGSTSQVSMRNGDLADTRVGWDGDWFVIDRKVPRRLHQVEKLRIVRKTGQLEYISKWSGDTELAGVKLRRIFDPGVPKPKPSDPQLGPIP
jgi:uncharacterized protein YaiL (DUF2058 family)